MLNKDLNQKDSISNSLRIKYTFDAQGHTHQHVRTKALHTRTHSHPDTNVSCNVTSTESLSLTCPSRFPPSSPIHVHTHDLHSSPPLPATPVFIFFHESTEMDHQGPQARLYGHFLIPLCGHLTWILSNTQPSFPLLP